MCSQVNTQIPARALSELFKLAWSMWGRQTVVLQVNCFYEQG